MPLRLRCDREFSERKRSDGNGKSSALGPEFLTGCKRHKGYASREGTPLCWFFHVLVETVLLLTFPPESPRVRSWRELE